MNIALLGPSHLTAYDQQEIAEFLETCFENEYNVHVLLYRNIEHEVLRYAISEIEEAKRERKSLSRLKFPERLFMYSVVSHGQLPKSTRPSVDFLVSQGAHYESFDMDEPILTRDRYDHIWREILARADQLIVFYDEDTYLENAKLLMPIDLCKKLGKHAFFYHLPKNNHEKHLLPVDEKLEKKA